MKRRNSKNLQTKKLKSDSNCNKKLLQRIRSVLVLRYDFYLLIDLIFSIVKYFKDGARGTRVNLETLKYLANLERSF